MLPSVGASSPAIRLNSVLLPQPDGPTIETKSPAPTRIETSRSASTGSLPPKRLLTPSTCSRSDEALLMLLSHYERRVVVPPPWLPRAVTSTLRCQPALAQFGRDTNPSLPA